jgi:hypothetical protein
VGAASWICRLQSIRDGQRRSVGSMVQEVHACGVWRADALLVWTDAPPWKYAEVYECSRAAKEHGGEVAMLSSV